MTRVATFAPALVFAMVLLVFAPSAVAAAKDFTLTLTADGATYAGPDGLAALVDASRGERYVWNLTLTHAYTVAEMRVAGAFDVARAKQVVPRIDGAHFVEVHGFDVAEVDHPARVLRLNESPTEFTYRLGIPGPGNFSLALTKDVTPPTFSIGAIHDVSHFGFRVETMTDEAALATLHVRRSSGGETVDHPTPDPDRLQKFPIIGLAPDTRYDVAFTFTDWSGNAASSRDYAVQTAARPIVPRPVIGIVTPLAGASIPSAEAVIRASISSVESPIETTGVRLYVDKIPVELGYTITLDGLLTYAPKPPLGPGFHAVEVNVTNMLGGTSSARWNFTVEAVAVSGREAPGPAGLAAVVAAAVACGLLPSRRAPKA